MTPSPFLFDPVAAQERTELDHEFISFGSAPLSVAERALLGYFVEKWEHENQQPIGRAPLEARMRCWELFLVSRKVAIQRMTLDTAALAEVARKTPITVF